MSGNAAAKADASPPGDRRASGGSEATSLRLRLRNETRMLHERLDASFAGLGQGGGLAAYPAFLRVNEACHREIEPAIRASGLARLIPFLEDGARHGAALCDMRALDLRPIALAAFPMASPTPAAAIGIAYVLEGSRLGARMILKRLRETGQLENGRPLPTLFLQAAGTPDRFRAFLEIAEKATSQREDRDEAVRSANLTFDYFLDAVRIASADPCDGRTI